MKRVAQEPPFPITCEILRRDQLTADNVKPDCVESQRVLAASSPLLGNRQTIDVAYLNRVVDRAKHAGHTHAYTSGGAVTFFSFASPPYDWESKYAGGKIFFPDRWITLKERTHNERNHAKN